MISFVSGYVDEIGDGYAVIDVGGIGFEVQISGETAAVLSGREEKDPVKLYTYMNVDREGAMSLIGFLSRDELSLFRLLITVNGVGPRAGLSLLSAIGADELRFAIACGDAKAIAKAPGIGRKTADRLVLELRDRMAAVAADGADTAEAAVEGTGGKDPGSGSAAANEAAEALTALGYGRMDAVNAVRKARGVLLEENAEEPDTEQLLKRALAFMG